MISGKKTEVVVMAYSQRSKLVKSLQEWKAKAIARRHENVALKKRMAELTDSRDAWKIRAQQYEAENAALQAEHHRLSHPASLPPKKRARPVQS